MAVAGRRAEMHVFLALGVEHREENVLDEHTRNEG